MGQGKGSVGYLALYPGLLTLASIAYSTKLVKCGDLPGCWVDVWDQLE